MAGNEIGVKVCQEHVRNPQVVLRGKRQILIDVTLRIDDGCRAALLVGNDVGGMRETVQIELLENHPTIMPQ